MVEDFDEVLVKAAKFKSDQKLEELISMEFQRLKRADGVHR